MAASWASRWPARCGSGRTSTSPATRQTAAPGEARRSPSTDQAGLIAPQHFPWQGRRGTELPGGAAWATFIAHAGGQGARGVRSAFKLVLCGLVLAIAGIVVG